MPRDLMGGAILALGVMVVVAAGLVAPPHPAAREIWVVTSSDKMSSRPQLVRAAHPDRPRTRFAGAH
jgi:hypothetical protein